jgi:hypothetical protein
MNILGSLSFFGSYWFPPKKAWEPAAQFLQ